jgi:hypothetical protein
MMVATTGTKTTVRRDGRDYDRRRRDPPRPRQMMAISARLRSPGHRSTPATVGAPDVHVTGRCASVAADVTTLDAAFGGSMRSVAIRQRDRRRRLAVTVTIIRSLRDVDVALLKLTGDP